jgi:gamma-glutamyl:cysteine ligase YbdK (ATP-grasp superfamily)
MLLRINCARQHDSKPVHAQQRSARVQEGETRGRRQGVDGNLIKDQIKRQLTAQDGDISDSDEDIDSTIMARCAPAAAARSAADARLRMLRALASRGDISKRSLHSAGRATRTAMAECTAGWAGSRLARC